MLNKLQIRYFRKNEKLDVDLKSITVFSGPSGRGKSSLVGAIKWVVFNSPSGTEYVHWDHKSSAVRLVEGKNKITRKRSKTENCYLLNGQKLEAFKTGVPDKISNLLNMSHLNFHRQHAGPFWFRETAGEVSRQLNSVVNLDLIDTTLSNLDRQGREANAEKTLIEQRIKDAKRQRRKLRYIVKIDKRLKSLEQISQQHKDNADRLIELTDSLQFAKQYQAEIAKPIPNTKLLIGLCKKYKRLKQQYETSQELTGRAEQYKEVIVQTGLETKRDEKELRKLIGKRCPLCGK